MDSEFDNTSSPSTMGDTSAPGYGKPVKFVDGRGANSSRIPDEEWERYKDIILEKYKTKKRETVKEEMKAEYGFAARYVYTYVILDMCYACATRLAFAS
jgi:hypothetical protein